MKSTKGEIVMKDVIKSIILILVFAILISCSDDNNTEPQNEAPSCNIISPVNNIIIEQGDSILVTAEAEDDSYISEVFFYLDNTELNIEIDSPYTCLIHTTDLSIGLHTVKAAANDYEGLRSVDSITIKVDKSIFFTNQNLEDKIRLKIEKPSGQIYLSDVDSITVLNADDLNISNLDGLEYCTSLQILDLSSNDISDISPISDLANLINLDLYNNLITDISPISNLVEVQILDLSGSYISDITPLSNLTELTSLGLNSTVNISDITPLSGLTNLTILDLYWNQISDLSPITDLVNLTNLDLSYNAVIDISALASLTKLEELNLSENFRINDISSLSGMCSMKELFLYFNQISDLSPLSDMTELTKLFLHYNSVSDITPLSNLTKMEELYLPYNALQDLTALTGLDSLSILDVKDNNIFDIYPLVQNSEFANGDMVDLTDNPLNTSSVNTYIPDLQTRGVVVTYGK